MELCYDAVLGRPRRKAGRISLSLPDQLSTGSRIKGDKVGFFFDNLLPDSEAIRAARPLALQHHERHAPSTCSRPIGRDCVGALQLLAGRREAGANHQDLSHSARRSRDREPAARDTSPIPLRSAGRRRGRIQHLDRRGAGEDRADLARGRWCRPHGATPTTHIFKLPLGLVGGRQLDHADVARERVALRANSSRSTGCPSPACEVKAFGRDEGARRRALRPRAALPRALLASPAAGRLLPSDGHAQLAEVRIGRRPRPRRYRARPPGLRRRARHDLGVAPPCAARLLDARRDRWAREELQPPSAPSGPLPPHSSLRRPLRLAADRRAPRPSARRRSSGLPCPCVGSTSTTGSRR